VEIQKKVYTMHLFYFLIFFFMKVLREFRDFAMKGNVVDLAVGVIIGGAFGKIVTSIVEDILMPVIGKIVGNVDFSNLYFSLSDKIPLGSALAEAKKLGPVIAYGNFLTIVINFAIIAFCIFMVVKAMTKAMPKKKEEPAPVGPTDIELLGEIRDLLKKA
jgi:large conductance mechanosensitive channel